MRVSTARDERERREVGPWVRGAYLALVSLFMLAPIVIVVLNSFNDSAYGKWPPTELSLRWYRKLGQSSEFLTSGLHSVEIAAVATVVSVVIGTLLAFAIVRYRFIGREFLRSLSLAPLIVPQIATGFAAFVFLNRFGLAESLWGLVLAHIVITLPFVVTVMAAGMARLDVTLEQAAWDLGAGKTQAFLKVSLPQLRPSVAAAAVFSFIISFDAVEISLFLTSTDYETLPVAMYIYMQKFNDPTLASLSTVLIVLAGIFTTAVGLIALRSRTVREALGIGDARGRNRT